MGCGISQVKADTRVVIVGASIAGLEIAELLWSYTEVVLIDTKDYFEYQPSLVRAPVQGEVLDDVTMSYASILKAHGNKASFIQAKLIQVNSTNSILVEHVDGK
jgi:NADH dehydrogenase FAD-containing subunit